MVGQGPAVEGSRKKGRQITPHWLPEAKGTSQWGLLKRSPPHCPGSAPVRAHVDHGSEGAGGYVHSFMPLVLCGVFPHGLLVGLGGDEKVRRPWIQPSSIYHSSIPSGR